MRILVDNGAYKCGNMGDVAMLQVTVARLRNLWPDADIRVFTSDSKMLATHVPDALPVSGNGRSEWFSDQYLLGRVHRLMPAKVSRALSSAKHNVRRRAPGVLGPVVVARARLAGGRSRDLREFLRAVRTCDLLVSCGQGSLGDHCVSHSHQYLNLLEMAALAGKRTAIFGQGLGPMRDEGLRRHAAQVLPKLDLISLREGQTAAGLVSELGVDARRVFVTGDDAIEPAYDARADAIGDALGVNVRVGDMAGVHAPAVDAIRSAIGEFASSRGVRLLPVPISRHSTLIDATAIRDLLREIDETADGGPDLDTSAKVIAQVGRCRVLVTGAYHAAVFALAQGIPVVSLANSDFFRIKFHGLAEMFGTGCSVIDISDGDVEPRLRMAIDEAWTSAESVREPLRRAAAVQIESGRRAYSRLYELATGSAPVSPHAELPATRVAGWSSNV